MSFRDVRMFTCDKCSHQRFEPMELDSRGMLIVNLPPHWTEEFADDSSNKLLHLCYTCNGYQERQEQEVHEGIKKIPLSEDPADRGSVE